MKNNRRLVVGVAAVAVWLAAGSPASANLIYFGDTANSGSGIGTQATILSYQHQGSSGTASAAIEWNGATDVFTLGANTILNGGANSQTRVLGASAINSGNEVALVWNSNEPDDVATLLALSLVFYAPNGTVVHEAAFDTTTCAALGFAGCVFPEVGNGTGGQGHIFVLDQAQAAIVDAAIAFYGGPGSIRAGIGTATTLTSVGDEEGGFETFNLAARDVPEPQLLALLGLALVSSGRFARRRMN